MFQEMTNGVPPVSDYGGKPGPRQVRVASRARARTVSQARVYQNVRVTTPCLSRGGDVSAVAQDFQTELERTFAQAREEGQDHVDIVSRELHRRVRGYPGRDHRMPVCCQVMMANVAPGDRVLRRPPSGQGASLAIRYRIPR